MLVSFEDRECPVTGKASSFPINRSSGSAFTPSNRSSNVTALNEPKRICTLSAVARQIFALAMADISPSKVMRPSVAVMFSNP